MPHLQEQQTSQTLIELHAAEDGEQLELSLFAGGNAKWHSHFGR
jgi:hypothetical protein